MNNLQASFPQALRLNSEFVDGGCPLRGSRTFDKTLIARTDACKLNNNFKGVSNE